MSLDIEPVGERIIVEREGGNKPKIEERTAGGIIKPQISQTPEKLSIKGTLIAAGDDCRDWVRALIGREVIFGQYAGHNIEGHEEKYVLMNETDLTGYVKEKTNVN